MLLAAMFLAGSLNCAGMVNAAEPKADTQTVMGDVNGDGTFGVTDVILFQKWLLAVPDTVLANWQAADFDADGELDVFDLSMMKTALIAELQGSPALEDPEVQEILFGYTAPGTGSSKPTSELKIAMKCKAFCTDKTLTVDVAKLGFSTADMYEGNGFLYRYSIYPYNPINYQKIENEPLIVNGEPGGYAKDCTGEDRLMFKLGIEYDDYSTYHHENSVLDFSNYPAGSSGSIAFGFAALFYAGDGTLPEKPQSDGSIQSLHFYVGEEGVGISNISVEDAEKSYQNKGKGEVTAHEQYTGRWHGKYITRELFEALTDPDAGKIPVQFSFKDTGMRDFESQGVEAFYQARIEETSKLLEEKGIRCETVADPHEMVMYVTAEQFTDLTLESASLFSLARV